MKKKILPILLCLSSLMLASNCSIFQKTKAITAAPATPPATPVVSVADSADASDGNNEKNAIPTEHHPETAVDKQLGGEWTIVKAYNKSISLETMPFLNFDLDSNKIYGNTGCNVVNGSFSIAKKGDLAFSNLLSTMMMCENSKIENSVLRALNEVTNYSISKINGMIHLNLLDKRGATVLLLKQHNLNTLNGAWTIQEIDGTKRLDDKVRLVIDIQELRIHGNSGCNTINGLIVLDPTKDYAIQFQQIASTRMMCPEMSTETTLLVALEEVESYKKNNTNEITFFDSKSQPVLVLKRLELK